MVLILILMRLMFSRCVAVVFALTLIVGTGFRAEAHNTSFSVPAVMAAMDCCDHMDGADHKSSKSHHQSQSDSCCQSGLCSPLAGLDMKPVSANLPAFALSTVAYEDRHTDGAGIEPSPSLDPPRPSA